jgi:hypothetical protein
MPRHPDGSQADEEGPEEVIIWVGTRRVWGTAREQQIFEEIFRETGWTFEQWIELRRTLERLTRQYGQALKKDARKRREEAATYYAQSKRNSQTRHQKSGGPRGPLSPIIESETEEEGTVQQGVGKTGAESKELNIQSRDCHQHPDTHKSNEQYKDQWRTGWQELETMIRARNEEIYQKIEETFGKNQAESIWENYVSTNLEASSKKNTLERSQEGQSYANGLNKEARVKNHGSAQKSRSKQGLDDHKKGRPAKKCADQELWGRLRKEGRCFACHTKGHLAKECSA